MGHLAPWCVAPPMKVVEQCRVNLRGYTGTRTSSLTSHICLVKEPNVRKLNLAGMWQERHWRAILKTWFYSRGKFVKNMMLS